MHYRPGRAEVWGSEKNPTLSNLPHPPYPLGGLGTPVLARGYGQLAPETAPAHLPTGWFGGGARQGLRPACTINLPPVLARDSARAAGSGPGPALGQGWGNPSPPAMAGAQLDSDANDFTNYLYNFKEELYANAGGYAAAVGLMTTMQRYT